MQATRVSWLFLVVEVEYANPSYLAYQLESSFKKGKLTFHFESDLSYCQVYDKHSELQSGIGSAANKASLLVVLETIADV